jgi:xylan 1,4-beta-xylosidase
MCSDFVAHVLTKYGLREIKRWTFRCWNEPDLKHFWHEADLHAYLKLYDHFAEGVKSVCPEAVIGGPALSGTKTYLSPENFTFFLDHITGGKNHATGGTGSPIDYLGVHTYGGQGGGPGPGREFPDAEYLMEQHLRYRDMRDRYPALEGMPIHVEEWGESSGGTNGVAEQPMSDIRNSEHSAAFLVSWVARHIELKQTGDTSFASFTFCSSGYERPREHDFMGYRTFHTKNGFHKPLLNAYKLLNTVASELVETRVDQTCNRLHAFASRDDQRVTVALCNYQPGRIYNDGPDCNIELSVNLPWEADAKVTISHWRIDGRHSNAYAAFKDIGSPADPTPEQIHAVKARMDLEQIEPPRKNACAEATALEVLLPCNAVSLVEFRRA